MDHNPLTDELGTMLAAHKALQRRQNVLAAEVRRFSQFSPETAQQSISGDKEAIAQATSRREKLVKRATAQKSKIKKLKSVADLGWDPTHWFSKKRMYAKIDLAKRREERDRTLRELEAVEHELAKRKKHRDSLQRQIHQHHQFDSAAASRELIEVQEKIEFQKFEIADLSARKDDLDRKLAGPMSTLEDLRKERKSAVARRSRIQSRVDDAKDRISTAEAFEHQLTNADNARERAIIHRECEHRLGEGSPRSVIRSARADLRSLEAEHARAGRTIASLDRNIEKSLERIAVIAARGSRDIRAIIVDGSNLCYTGQTFIGLSALMPLSRHLIDRYAVTIVFDASIRRLISRDDLAMLRSEVRDAEVHVVASRSKADETILSIASDSSCFILSNDRFAEFGDEEAVRGNRLITHEILNGRIIVHDLEINLSIGRT